jgi:hypothetical protein
MKLTAKEARLLKNKRWHVRELVRALAANPAYAETPVKDLYDNAEAIYAEELRRYPDKEDIEIITEEGEKNA